MGIQSGEWHARCGAPQWRAEWRAHTGLQRHRLVPRPASIARAMASAGRARAARKSIMMLTFCVRRSPGDSAAATGWSGERRPMGPLAVFLPCPYRIVSVCRSAAALLARRGLRWLLRYRAPRCGARLHPCSLGRRCLGRHPARSSRAALASTLARTSFYAGAHHGVV